MQIFRSESSGPGGDGPVPGKVLLQPPPDRPSRYSRSRIVGDFLIHEWNTAYGTIGWAHYLKAPGARARALSGALYSQFGSSWHDVYAALALPSGPTELDYSPSLEAIDLYPDAVRSRPYKVTWAQLAGILGTSPPWWHWALRDLETMEAWRPGDPLAVIPPDHIELPARPLLELAADEPDGSPAAAACLWMARQARGQAGATARKDIDQLRDEAAAAGGDCARVHVAAVPVPPQRGEETRPGELALRAAWAQITERRDPLSWQVAILARRWNGGKEWPAGETAEFTPDSSPAAAEWTAGLQPVPADQPPTVLERLLLKRVETGIDQGEVLQDPVSGYPALRRTGHRGKVTMFACIPQRIASVSELAEVILADLTVWIRTRDGRLWLAPTAPGAGLNWGYRGAGPAALARLLDMLLDDITTTPVQQGDSRHPDDGLYRLVESAPQHGVTTWTREQLLAARGT